MGASAPVTLAQAARGGSHRLVARGGRLEFDPGGGGGEKTGPNPTDRSRKGTKHHVLTDGQGIPLAFEVTGANVHDVTQMIALVDGVPPIAGQSGRPRSRPLHLFADRAYDSRRHFQQLRRRGIVPQVARRGKRHGSGLGIYRWVVERTLAWLHQYRRLRVRYERQAMIHEAFVWLGCILITWRFLETGF